MKDRQLAVPAVLVQQVIDYLKDKPFIEVHQFIQGLMQCPQVNIQEEKAKTPREVLEERRGRDL